MFKHKIILALFIFVLVSPRAKIYGQRIEVVDFSLLKSGLDSVILAHKLNPDSVCIILDSLDRKIFTTSAKYFTCDSLIILHFSGYRKIYNNSSLQQGQDYVSATGELRYKEPYKKKEFFSIEKSTNFASFGGLEPNEPKSFWDSTAKPILVTLGAIAVIALFFLVRG